jgi:hypothetical protein
MLLGDGEDVASGGALDGLVLMNDELAAAQVEDAAGSAGPSGPVSVSDPVAPEIVRGDELQYVLRTATKGEAPPTERTPMVARATVAIPKTAGTDRSGARPAAVSATSSTRPIPRPDLGAARPTGDGRGAWRERLEQLNAQSRQPSLQLPGKHWQLIAAAVLVALLLLAVSGLL